MNPSRRQTAREDVDMPGDLAKLQTFCKSLATSLKGSSVSYFDTMLKLKEAKMTGTIDQFNFSMVISLCD